MLTQGLQAQDTTAYNTITEQMRGFYYAALQVLCDTCPAEEDAIKRENFRRKDALHSIGSKSEEEDVLSVLRELPHIQPGWQKRSRAVLRPKFGAVISHSPQTPHIVHPLWSPLVP